MPRLRALILEDNPSDAELVLAELRRSGFEVDWERVDSEAGFLERLHPGLDVIISDYSMPQFDARRALELLQESGLELPFIIVSGTVGEETAVAAMRAGATDYLLKDRLARLGMAVTRALEQARTETQLQLTRDRYRAVVEDQSELICRWLPDTTLTFVNAACCRYFGRTGEELLGTQFLPLIHPEDRDEFLARLRGLAPERPFTTYEQRVVLEGGELRWLQWTDRGIFGADGRLRELQSVGRDVTDRRRQEEARLRLETAIEQAGEMVMITDAEGVIEYVNPAFEASTGYSREEALGQTPRILRSGEHDEVFYRGLYETITRGDVWKGRLVNRNKDGSLAQVDMSISPVRSTAGEIVEYVAVSRDVTAQVELEQAFLQAQKMEAVGQLAGGVAHDFNNLLTAISGYSELLLLRSDDDPELRADVEEIARAANRAAGLTQQLLSFSRKQAVKPETLDLSGVVRDFQKLLVRILGEDVRLELKLANDPPPVLADRGQLEQVIVNLAVNARDAMPGGGSLTIATGNSTVDEQEAVASPGLEPGRYTTLTVADSGLGMSRETQARIFEPFFTTKEPGKGTGLGLSTVFGIVKKAGGYIDVETAPGEGSRFRILLPAIEAQERPAVKVGSGPVPVLRGRTILLVEDEKAAAILIQRLLEREGHEVLLAFDGEEALEICREHGAAIDLLITDVILPGIAGPDLVSEVRRMRPGTKVLYMSGYSGEILSRKDLEAPDLVLLQKPFGARELAKAIGKVLGPAR